MYSQTEYIMKWYQSKTMCFPASLIIIQLCTDDVLQNTNHCITMAKWHSLPLIYTFFCLSGRHTAFLAIHSTVVQSAYALHSFLLSWHWDLLMIWTPQLTSCYPLMRYLKLQEYLWITALCYERRSIFWQGPTLQKRGRNPIRRLTRTIWYFCHWKTSTSQLFAG